MDSELQLLELCVDALFTHDPNGRIRSVNEPGGGPAPRFFFGRTAAGNLWRFHSDLPENLVRRLEELASHEPLNTDLRAAPRNLAAFQEALADDHEIHPAYCGPAYRFPAELPMRGTATRITPSNLELLRNMPEFQEDIAQYFEARDPIWVVIEDGMAVSLCFTARLTKHAAAAGVETLEEYRGRGYAGATVAAWAGAIHAGGRIPLYDTSWDNLASQAVARTLGLIQYGVILWA